MGMSPGIDSPSDDAESLRTIAAALDAGVTLIDTGIETCGPGSAYDLTGTIRHSIHPDCTAEIGRARSHG